MVTGRIFAAGLVVLAALSSAQAAEPSASLYVVRYDHWTDADEREFGEFVTSIGKSDCRTVDDCLHGPGNPFRASDPPGHIFKFDCAEFGYFLRAYFAWKRGLPFSYESAVAPRGATRDFRYTPDGNGVTARTDIPGGKMSGYQMLELVRSAVSSASYRIHPDAQTPLPQDFYSPVIAPKSIRPGTIIYDAAGHVGTVYRIDPDGRIIFLDAHPDNSLTRSFYNTRFARERPGVGAGFKNWRPARLVGATRQADGTLTGGHMVLAANSDIPDFSDEQYYGNGARPKDSDWTHGTFTLNGDQLDYYDYVRAKMSGGKLQFDPLKEVADMVVSNCADLQYRADAVKLASDAGIEHMDEPQRLPPNIYGTEGAWEIYSTPSRDARLKTAFKELRDSVERFVNMYETRDPKLVYAGDDLSGDIERVYRQQTAACKLSYTKSDGTVFPLTYQQAEKRLFLVSFDPYQCVERRWGATGAAELSTCNDGAEKRNWYEAERKLRNQIDRTYEARMDFTRAELAEPGAGKGVEEPPDIDVIGYLELIGRVYAGGLPPETDAPRTTSSAMGASK